MAASSTSQGYQYQFLDSVPEDLYCKQCSLVARKLTITSCCGESYCKGCIVPIQQAKKPCPECGEESFETYPHAKSQKKILCLQVYCPHKKKGCGWCSRLDELDAHLDPDEGDCEYVDLPCPFNCYQKIARKDITHHTANECAKRDYICPYCSFKAVYEIVVDNHWPECSYYPLPCPNRCGVTCERPTMEDHIKICPLQEVECEFQHVGCEAKFRREDEEEHMREKSQTHLTMTLKTNQELQQKISILEERLNEQDRNVMSLKELLEQKQGQNQKFQEELKKSLTEHEQAIRDNAEHQDKKLMEKLAELEKTLYDQEQKFQEQERKQTHELRKNLVDKCKEMNDKMREQDKKQERKLKDSKKRLTEQEKKLQEQDTNFQEQKLQHLKWSKELEKRVQNSLEMRKQECLEAIAKQLSMDATKKTEKVSLPWKQFSIESFSAEIEKSDNWKSQAMYTHMNGYKFCIGIDVKGFWASQENGMNVEVWAMEGEYDDQLTWPAKAQFAIELINHYPNGENKKGSVTKTWSKPRKCTRIGTFETEKRFLECFIKHPQLPHSASAKTHFLKDDSLHFIVSQPRLTHIHSK